MVRQQTVSIILSAGVIVLGSSFTATAFAATKGKKFDLRASMDALQSLDSRNFNDVE